MGYFSRWQGVKGVEEVNKIRTVRQKSARFEPAPARYFPTACLTLHRFLLATARLTICRRWSRNANPSYTPPESSCKRG